MNISYDNKLTCSNAIGAYNCVPSLKDTRHRKWLLQIFDERGWKLNFDGSDKYVATRGNIVAKWLGKCNWSFNPIIHEAQLYEALKQSGFKHYVPHIYFLREDFILQQKLNTAPKADDEKYWKFIVAAARISNKLEGKIKLYGKPVSVLDLHEENIGQDTNGRWKIIDGGVG